jgi:hypothetical protein
MTTIALVSCVKQKREVACRARDLYVSSLFRKSVAYAASKADRWFILSAKYGLVDPDEVIEPHEQTLNSASAAERREWAASVHRQMAHRGLLDSEPIFLWLAGRKYQEHLARLLRDFRQQDPLAGLRMGERMQWLNTRIEDEEQTPPGSLSLAERIDDLLLFLPLFESGRLPEGPSLRSRDGAISIDDGDDHGFVEALYAGGWVTPFDWVAWKDEAEAFVGDPKRLESASLSEVEKLLTTHARQDRFCSGHIAAMAECGHLTAILHRLRAIRDGMDGSDR